MTKAELIEKLAPLSDNADIDMRLDGVTVKDEFKHLTFTPDTSWRCSVKGYKGGASAFESSIDFVDIPESKQYAILRSWRPQDYKIKG